MSNAISAPPKPTEDKAWQPIKFAILKHGSYAEGGFRDRYAIIADYKHNRTGRKKIGITTDPQRVDVVQEFPLCVEENNPRRRARAILHNSEIWESLRTASDRILELNCLFGL